MKRKGHAVRYPPCDDSAMAKFYNYLLEEGHVDSKLLGNVFGEIRRIKKSGLII